SLGVLVLIGLGILEQYVQEVNQARQVKLQVELKDPPTWASKSLISQVCLSTGIQGDDDFLEKGIVQEWAGNLRSNPWVKQVRQMRRRYDGRLEIDCALRRPVASVAAVLEGEIVYYVDAEGVLLPAAPLDPRVGHLVRLRGERVRRLEPGGTIESPAMLAGLAVLAEIRAVDERLPADEQLWQEIAVMDVSNFQGRIDDAQSHLVMYTASNTEIRWGAALGESEAYLEAPETAKLRRLYRNHAKYKTLEVYEYVDLRNRRQDLADPLRDNVG
ncbi:MAG: hypothetical protein JW741_24135, partial [Sedimentisphaerales bacterium]|nr:hypothetical protein [Sedimentisphaerales bacterium]